MTKRQRIEAVYGMRKADRVPFVPAIYEHKGALIQKSPSETCRNAEYLYDSVKAEFVTYDPDMVVVGIDVYNVEAEALGCKVVYLDESTDVPAIIEPLIDGPGGLSKVGVPDPETGGRMPLHLDVAGKLQREWGNEVIVRGAVTGPYSMAGALMGAEQFIFLTLENAPAAHTMLEFCARVTVEYGKAFLRRGVQPIIFDSRATPMLASPRVIRELLAPIYRDCVFPQLKAAGGRFLPLIIGGNTTSVIDSLLATGATQFLSDSPANLKCWCEKAMAARVPVRANVDAALVARGPASEIHRRATEILRECRDYPGLLLGCGVVPYDVKPEHVMAIHAAIADMAAEDS
ncbi:MAG TPA: uroporphyrinogen decarboxylase family protein [Bryobacteraceae bacterium]|nr:uroporphyrinogen decarboxylase family protein [Bryobacteraceae bacterium]